MHYNNNEGYVQSLQACECLEDLLHDIEKQIDFYEGKLSSTAFCDLHVEGKLDAFNSVKLMIEEKLEG